MEARAILTVKIVQLIKLKSAASKAVVDVLVKILNDDTFGENDIDFYPFIYA